jgi:hypothetical protein
MDRAKDTIPMQDEILQIELAHNSITAKIIVFDGVLATRVFEGIDCYDQFVDFLKSQYGIDRVIHSSVILSSR